MTIEAISNVQNEVLFVGSIYKEPELYLKYYNFVRSGYDFFDEATRFFYDNFETMYKTFTQTVDESKLNTFMSQNDNRMETYKQYGGYTTIKKWMDLAYPDDFDKYYDTVKKFSLLREYQRKGFPVDKIMAHIKFDIMTSMDIYRFMRTSADRIHTVIMTNAQSSVLNNECTSALLECTEMPDIGIPYPYPILTDIFRGIRTSNFTCFGMLSNAGKTRFMMKIVAYIALVLNEKVQVLLNEMTIREVRFCLITTVINNPEFQAVHGIVLNKQERELTLGLYRDRDGNFIYRRTDEDGNFVEPLSEYQNRLRETSDEFNKVMQIAQWIDENTEGKIFVKDICSDYTDSTLQYEITQAKMLYGIKYFFYDTFKNEQAAVGDWAGFKATAAKLKELANSNDVFIGATIQLTDDTIEVHPLRLSSMNIASCKQIKHELDNLILFKEIDEDDFHNYQYIPYLTVDELESGWKSSPKPLEFNNRYTVGIVDKNRQGRKGYVLFKFDLNLNSWQEVGEVQLIKSKAK